MDTTKLLTSDGSCLRLRPAASDLLAASGSGVEFLSTALKRKMFADAIDFAAQWLPRRHVVWWGCLCGWQVLRGSVSPATTAALRAAADWVIDPSERNRRRAEAAGLAADFATPEGNLALAAFHSGDSIAPEGLPAVSPAPNLTNATVANAITLLLTRVAPEQKQAVQDQFTRLALALADGQLLWPAAPAASAAAEPAPPGRAEGRPADSVAGATPPPLEPGKQKPAGDPVKDDGKNQEKDLWDQLSQIE